MKVDLINMAKKKGLLSKAMTTIRLRIVVLGVMLLLNMMVFAQWECRSNLSGHLKPVYATSAINWAGEIVGSSGYLSNSNISNGMAFLGLDYSHNNHQFYFEGGIKVWNKYDYDLDINFSKWKTGLREVSYNYFTLDFNLSIGLQQVKLPNSFLLNERGWGVSFNKESGLYRFSGAMASVTKDIARNGSFCTNCFLYDITPVRNQPLGNSFGDTNFAFVSFEKAKGEKESASDNEYDEFNDFESVSQATYPSIESYGGVIYSEFGGYYDNPDIYLGLHANFLLFNNAHLSVQTVYQGVKENSAVLYSVDAEKVIEWQTGNLSTLHLGYIAKLDLDDGALASPRFSNLFLGEVFRMDVVDMPLVNLIAKHQIVDKKLSLKIQYSRQIKGKHMHEFDMSVGKYFFNKKLRTTVLSGLMKSDNMEEYAKLARLELRVFF